MLKNLLFLKQFLINTYSQFNIYNIFHKTTLYISECLYFKRDRCLMNRFENIFVL